MTADTERDALVVRLEQDYTLVKSTWALMEAGCARRAAEGKEG